MGKCRSITVIDGRIVGKKHPEDDHQSECKPVPKEFIDVLEIDRGMRSEVRRTGKRPREAFTEAVTSIAKKFKSSAEQNAVIAQFPTFSEVRGVLYRRRSKFCVPVPNVCDIPDELRSTVRGKSV